MRALIGITAATGMLYAVRLVETLRQMHVDTCLIMSRDAATILLQETGYPVSYLKDLVDDFYYEDTVLSPAPGRSGVPAADAMIMIPCSVKSLASLVHDAPVNFLQAAAGNTLKTGKKLVLVASEPVYRPEQLDVLLHLAYQGAVIMPYMPSFYHQPATIDDIVSHHTGRILDLLGIDHNLVKRWGEASPGPVRP